MKKAKTLLLAPPGAEPKNNLVLYLIEHTKPKKKQFKKRQK